MKSLRFGVHPIKSRRKNKNGQTSKTDPPDLGEVAIWNEYGTATIPPRPAFRMGLEAAVKKHKKLLDAQLKNIAQLVLTGRHIDIDRNLTVLLTQIGRSAKKETQDIIRAGSTTPNAPSTIARKGFDHPLYEEGVLLENVDYEVIDE